MLGIGHATLTAVRGAVPLTVADVPGVVVAGVTIDAGTVKSPVLLQVGKRHGHHGGHWKSRRSDPTTLSDVYFRVGGPHIGKADTALEVNSDNVLIDHTWVWRADHGVEGFTDTERWNTNRARNGVVVNGDDVTATGLFVEHFQQYNTVWNGEDGVVILYQNELPYDPPTQADWMHDGVEGWAGYKVGNRVKRHRLYGGGVYVFNQNNPSIHTENGFEVPQTPGVQLHHVMTVNLSAGTIDHVVNGVGDPADTTTRRRPRLHHRLSRDPLAAYQFQRPALCRHMTTAPDAPLTAALLLGWRVAELYALVDDTGEPAGDTLLPSHGSLEPADQLELQLCAAAGDARRAGVTAKDAALDDLVSSARAAAASPAAAEVFRARLRRRHIEVQKDLWARDEAFGKAYELGNGLSDTYGRVCRAYRHHAEDALGTWEDVFLADRIERLKKLLDDLQSRLNTAGVAVVRAQLDAWCAGVGERLREGGLPPEERVREGLRRQTVIWRQLLTGDKAPEAYLDRHARAALHDDLRGLIWRRYRRWAVVLAAAILAVLLAWPHLSERELRDRRGRRRARAHQGVGAPDRPRPRRSVVEAAVGPRAGDEDRRGDTQPRQRAPAAGARAAHRGHRAALQRAGRGAGAGGPDLKPWARSSRGM